MIDLRSDTVTQPTPGMRRAMHDAEVGDDCFGDDPSVRELEARCAALFGKPAALFTIGGTQSNQIAMKTLTQPGDEVILEAGAHINYYESAATAAFSGLNFSLVHSDSGVFDVADIERLRASKCRWNANYALPRVVVLENTLGCHAGRVFPRATFQRVAAHAHAIGAAAFLDGARVLHAYTATGVTAAEWAAPVDLLAMCLSKGLGAPVGSVLVGSEALIQRARRFRKWFGGDMHQSGVLAAAGLYALDHHVERLHEDHAMALQLARRLQDLDDAHVVYGGTNMVLLDVGRRGVDPMAFVERLKALGVAALPCLPTQVRFVPHLGNTPRDIDTAAAQVARLWRELQPSRHRSGAADAALTA